MYAKQQRPLFYWLIPSLLVFRAFFRPSHHFLLSSSAIAEYCAQNLFPQEEYDSLPRKQDVVMPAPEICKDGVNLQVGQFKFKLTHKLSQLGLTSTLLHHSKPQSSLWKVQSAWNRKHATFYSTQQFMYTVHCEHFWFQKQP